MIFATIRVSGSDAQPVCVCKISRGTVGGQIQIEYVDSLWSNLTKTVVFRGCGVTKDVTDAEELVTIPAEVLLKAGGRLLVGIYGTDSSGSVAIPTVWADLGRIWDAADPSGDTTTDQTLPVWAQMLEQIKTLEDQVENSDCAVFTPVIEDADDGITLGWENNGGLPNPEAVTIPKPSKGALTVDSIGEGLLVDADRGTLEAVTATYEHMAAAGLTGYLVEDGAVTEYANNYVSDFVKITKGSSVRYCVNAIAGVAKVLCFYDEDKNFIGCVDASGATGAWRAHIGEFTLPEDAAYIRYSMQKSGGTDEINQPDKQYVVYSTGEPPVGVPVVRVDPEFVRQHATGCSVQIEALYPDKTASGEIVGICDGIPGTRLRGVTVNDGTQVNTVKLTGKNVFFRDYAAPVSGIGITAQWDAQTQEFVLNGTTTAAGDLKLINPMSIGWLPGEKYTFSVRQTGGSASLAAGSGSTTFAWGVFASNASKFARGSTGLSEFPEIYHFTAEAFAFASYTFYFQCWRPGTVFDNYRVKIQIERGSSLTDWEPYTEQSAAIENADTLILPDGCSYVLTSPRADITVRYAVTPQTYTDDATSGKSLWHGKKWFAFGTSITDTGYTNGETGTPTGKYVPYLAAMSGLQVTNKGQAGGTIGKGGTYGGSASILKRILDTDLSSADLITIEGFVNDFACEVPIGEPGDTGGTDAVEDMQTITVCGALYRALKHCLETAPNATVILLTESTGKVYTMKEGQTANYRFDLRKGANNLCQGDYNDAIIRMGHFVGVRVIDAGSKSQINFFNPEYIVDQIHHTELGGKQYATVIWDELKSISPKITE